MILKTIYVTLSAMSLFSMISCQRSNQDLFRDAMSTDSRTAMRAAKEIRSRIPDIEGDLIERLRASNDHHEVAELLRITEGVESNSLRRKALELAASRDSKGQRVGISLMSSLGQCEHLSNDSLVTLMAALSSKQQYNRLVSLSCLAKDRGVRSRQIVKSFFATSAGQERASYLDAIAGSKNRSWMPVIIASLSDDDRTVRSAAILAGMELDGNRMRRVLAGRHPDPDPEVRALILDILGG